MRERMKLSARSSPRSVLQVLSSKKMWSTVKYYPRHCIVLFSVMPLPFGTLPESKWKERGREKESETERLSYAPPLLPVVCVTSWIVLSFSTMIGLWNLLPVRCSVLVTHALYSCVDYIVVGKLPVCAAGREWFVYLPVAKRMNHS